MILIYENAACSSSCVISSCVLADVIFFSYFDKKSAYNRKKHGSGNNILLPGKLIKFSIFL